MINVYPKDSSSSFLNVVVGYFNLRNADAEDVPSAIFDLPEVQSRLRALGIVSSKAVEYEGPLRSLPRFSITMTEVSVREILNEIVRKGYSGYWKINRYGEEKKYVSIWL